MLRRVKDLEKCTIGGTDGSIGSVQDFYFDDESWVIRYLVADTGTWLQNRKVLISPHSIRDWGWEGNVVPVSITREQVRHSPDIDTKRPVSRQQEISYLGYYGYPYYWGGGGLWGPLYYPRVPWEGIEDPPAKSKIEAPGPEHEDPHLRSCNVVSHYFLHASDGEIGHVQSYLIDEKSWAIRFLIVNTSNWWLGHQVLIAPEWIDSVSWLEATVMSSLTREAVRESPRYDPAATLDSAAEARIYKHYGRAAYRNARPKSKVA